MLYNRSMDTFTRSTVIKDLSREIVMNDFGLPVGIYRVDLLPWHNFLNQGEENEPVASQSGPKVVSSPSNGDGSSNSSNSSTAVQLLPATEVVEVEQRIAGFLRRDLTQAFMELSYDEGYPTLVDGTPFWNTLPFEPHDAYAAFQRYLQMPMGRPAPTNGEDGADDDGTEEGTPARGTRSIADLAALRNQTDLLEEMEKLTCYSHLYYWGFRTKAYDLFRITAHNKAQELRAIETQDEHYILARKLKARLAKYFDSDEDFWDMMTPKTGIEMLRQLTQMERVSAGMPAMGPPTGESAGRGGQSFQVAFRSMAQEQNVGMGVDADGALIDGSTGHVLAEALKDPERTNVLQELILKVG